MPTESVVVAGVVDHFSAPKFARYSVSTEYPIQMGSDNRRADVVLINEYGELSVIIECKKLGYQGQGLEQLQSYLTATGTLLGVFANNEDPNAWVYLKNSGQNEFLEITPDKFEKQVLRRGMFEWLRRLFRGTRNGRARIKNKGNNIARNGSAEGPEADDIPYYSEQNGYDQGEKHRGLPECVPQHIKIIISNAKQEEIDKLHNEKKALEEQNEDLEREMEQKSQRLVELKEELVGVKKQLQEPEGTELSSPPDPHYDWP